MKLLKRAELIFCTIFILSLCLYKCLDGYVAQNYLLAFHLPGHVKPEEYNLKIFTNLDTSTDDTGFYGHVHITVMFVLCHYASP